MPGLISTSKDTDELDAGIIYVQWKSRFILYTTAILLAISSAIFYTIAYIFYIGYLSERNLIIVCFVVAVTELHAEIFVGVYAWYSGKRFEPYTNKLADVIRWGSLLMRLLEPVMGPIRDGINHYLLGKKTPQEQRIEALERENAQLRELLKRKKKWFRRGHKPPQNE